MNPNYINECTKIIGKHNKQENLIAILGPNLKLKG
jgi:hypothetical protein